MNWWTKEVCISYHTDTNEELQAMTGLVLRQKETTDVSSNEINKGKQLPYNIIILYSKAPGWNLVPVVNT